MYQLISASQYRDLTVSEVVEGIVDKAKENNLRDHLTGILVFSSGYFLHCLEGERSAVNKTFLRVSHDERHYDFK